MQPTKEKYSKFYHQHCTGNHWKQYYCCSSTSSSPGSDSEPIVDRYKRGRGRTGEQEGNSASNRSNNLKVKEGNLPRITILSIGSLNRCTKLAHSGGAGGGGESGRGKERRKVNSNELGRSVYPYFNGETDRRPTQTLSNSSRKLLEDNEEFERKLWRAARDYQQLEHYDHSLFGLDPHLDRAVGLHQREAMLYSQGELRMRLQQLASR